jgi:hypothetical protein
MLACYLDEHASERLTEELERHRPTDSGAKA